MYKLVVKYWNYRLHGSRALIQLLLKLLHIKLHKQTSSQVLYRIHVVLQQWLFIETVGTEIGHMTGQLIMQEYPSPYIADCGVKL